MANVIFINPNRATIFPTGMDDQIVNGLQFLVDPNGLQMTIAAGRVRINSMYMDMTAQDTDFSAAPLGRSLMALDQTLTIRFLEDNFGDYLVIGVVDKKVQNSNTILFITPILYVIYGEAFNAVPQDVFSPNVSVETQIRMLFNEMAVNKTKDAELKYSETLEDLPDEYNSILIETFENTTYFYTNELVYNPYTRTISLGLVAPYPINTSKKLIEKVVLPNSISTGYFMADFMSNNQTVNIRFSYDNGTTWQAYTGDNFYSAGVGRELIVETTLQSVSPNVTPTVRGWALFYNRQ